MRDRRIEEANSLNLAISKAGTERLNKAIECGGILVELKAEAGHGNWEDWVKDNLTFTRRTASDYMLVHRNREELKKRIEDESIVDFTEAVRIARGWEATKRGKHQREETAREVIEFTIAERKEFLHLVINNCESTGLSQAQTVLQGLRLLNKKELNDANRSESIAERLRRGLGRTTLRGQASKQPA